jgi:hypothetical protein
MELDRWETDPFEIKCKSLYYFAFELILQDASSKYFYVPDMKLSEQFIKGEINIENM